jgi:hypothetical protein
MMGNRIKAMLAIAAVGALAAGCGGDDDGDGGAGDTPEAILACVEDAGLTGTTQPERPNDQLIGRTGGVEINVPPNNRIVVNLFESGDEATEHADGEAAFLSPTGGTSEVVGETAVVGVLRRGAEDDFETVKGCVE